MIDFSIVNDSSSFEPSVDWVGELSKINIIFPCGEVFGYVGVDRIFKGFAMAVVKNDDFELPFIMPYEGQK